jgi:hypothetical protein
MPSITYAVPFFGYFPVALTPPHDPLGGMHADEVIPEQDPASFAGKASHSLLRRGKFGFTDGS